MVHMLAGQFTCSLLQSTALREIWAKLYQLACEAGENADNGTSISSLNRRILSSMKPDGAMVFLLDLSSTGRRLTQHFIFQ